MNQLDMQGRHAVVTGGASGLGFAIVQRLLQSGARVTLWDLNQAGMDQARQALRTSWPNATVEAVEVNLADHAQVVRAVAQTVAMAPVDALVNSAGISGPNMKSWDYPLDEWRKVMDINVNGLYYCCRELVPHMSVVDNLLVARHARMRAGLLAQGLFNRRVRNEAREHRQAVERIIEFVELERWRHADVAGLPFGLQKVVGFARALAMEPALLLLDEPSSGLNRDERENLARFILRVRIELGVPMIWVEHDMQMVSDLADRLVVLAHGRPLAEGSPAQVLNQPEVIEAYLGRRARTTD